MISCSNSPLAGRVEASNHSIGRFRATTGALGLPRMRTALPDVLIIFPGAQHPINLTANLCAIATLATP